MLTPTDGLTARQVAILCLSGNIRRDPWTGLLAIGWTDPDHAASLSVLVADLEVLVNAEHLRVSDSSGPATPWETSLHRALGLDRPDVAHLLQYQPLGILEDLQCRYNDDGERLTAEFAMFAPAVPAEQVAAEVARAGELIGALGTALAAVQPSAVPRGDPRRPATVSDDALVDGLTVEELMCSAFLSLDRSAEQLRLTGEIAAQFQEASNQDGPRPEWVLAGQALLGDTRYLDLSREVCRVCGWWENDDFYDEAGIPLYGICSCCGAESGADDMTWRSARRYRKAWIESGARWFDPSVRPDDWTVETYNYRTPRKGDPVWRAMAG